MRRRTDDRFRKLNNVHCRLLAGLLLTAMLGTGLGSAVSAQKVIDTPADCSINLKLEYKDPNS